MDPDPHKNVMDPEHCWIVISWIAYIAVMVYPRETSQHFIRPFEQNIPISSSAAPFRLYWPGPKL
jgi:hypothetical protein